ncbi:hypothetical protein SAMN07250955_104298 [Arboricoccus pini]|uniref:Uncharacterized protein n=1 Tax=Arboricoccus pini TaxID=1963835 RepID=A0A212R0Q1_9PROT|nr:hypothetical protein SAMN07250955_104298 [Arboricoccus pini]
MLPVIEFYIGSQLPLHRTNDRAVRAAAGATNALPGQAMT